MKVRLYKNPGCMKCKFTIRKFKEAGINPITEYFDEASRRYAQHEGYSAAPLVQIYNDDGALIDEWNDLNIKKIDEYIEKFKHKED